jgi:Delta24-sterol reductase
MQRHRELVEDLACQVRGFYQRGEKFWVHHGSTNSTRHKKYTSDNSIDISGLNQVLAIDTEKHTVLAEPNVPMDKLVEITLRHKLIPPVVPEFPGITVGGAFSGTAGESSSFKYGFFDCTVNRVEIVLATGEIVSASQTQRSDLFHGAAGALGTLGVLTLLEVQLKQATTYVELTYHPITSVLHALQVLQAQVAKDDNDFIDGIITSSKSGVVITGRLIDEVQVAPTSTNRITRFTRRGDPWFYMHASEVCHNNTVMPTIELVPTTDYLFRYDRGAFWMGYHAFGRFSMFFSYFSRYMLDYYLRARTLYRQLHKFGSSERLIIQDLAVPLSNTESFIKWIDEELGIYPLWLCPLKQPQEMSMNPGSSFTTAMDTLHIQELLVNVGVWGRRPKTLNHVDINRRIEAKLQEVRGRKWLYAQAYYTEKEFWTIYNKSWYDSLRKKYFATTLPTVYDKISPVRSGVVQRPNYRSILLVWPLKSLYRLWENMNSRLRTSYKSHLQ